MNVQLLPAILPTSYTDLVEKVALVVPPATRIQIDIVDGVFAAPSTWPIGNKADNEWQEILTQDRGLPKWENVEYEIDLMVENPKEHMSAWIDAGASTLIFHFESCSNDALIACAQKAKDSGTLAGIAIKPSSVGYEPLLAYFDLVQVMGNDQIGKQGVALDEGVYEVVSNILKAHPTITIGVDIGVNKGTIKKLVPLGVTHLVVGSAVFSDSSPKNAYKQLLELV